GLVAAVGGCVSHPPTCTRNSDCVGTDGGAEPGVCSASGFCVRECESNRDCGGLSRCDLSCGLCMAGGQPATCFTQVQGVAAADNACVGRFADDSSVEDGAVETVDAGDCRPPARDAGSGAGGDAGPMGDAGGADAGASVDSGLDAGTNGGS
ncbi:MAG: hypothetical protein K8H88_06055, partial [Sandaracinaceae bacterium]|nr:hypothetical protein [Sandaracinaceae bacterium]